VRTLHFVRTNVKWSVVAPYVFCQLDEFGGRTASGNDLPCFAPRHFHSVGGEPEGKVAVLADSRCRTAPAGDACPGDVPFPPSSCLSGVNGSDVAALVAANVVTMQSAGFRDRQILSFSIGAIDGLE